MTTLETTLDATFDERRPSSWRILWLESKLELLKVLRMPAFAVPTIAFPVLFYCLFGLSMNQTFPGGGTMAEYLLATYGVFGVVGAALFSFGVGVATERGQGWLQVKRASPMPPAAYFLAKLFTCLVFALAITACLFVLAATAGGVRLSLGGWALLAGLMVAGAVPFCAFGLALGTLCGPNSAPAVVNLLYLPMSFASGLWIPLRVLPDFFQGVAPWLPPYHLAQLALKVVGFDEGGSVVLHLVALAAATVVSLGVAVVAFRSGDDRTWG